MQQFLAGVGLALLAGLLYAFGLVVTVVLGYFAGVIITVIPFLGDLLTDSIGLTEQQIPNITAWLAVASLYLRANVGGGE